MSKKAAELRRMIKAKDCVMAAGVYDGLSALLAKSCGFQAGVMGGYALSAALLGKPDIGLLTMTEMSRSLRYIDGATSLPVIADADTGYGNPLNVERTVEEYENAGAAAILLEDQVAPKRCGHMEGKEVIPAEEHAQKIRAALTVRRDPQTIIIARTDARAVNGIDDAINRAKRYRDAGADMTFVESPLSLKELERIVKEIDAPQVANMVEGGKTPQLSIEELSQMGFKIAFYPVGPLYAAAGGIRDYMRSLKQQGSVGNYENMLKFDEFNELVSLREIREKEKKYTDKN
jgi:methylisocitrate lyase